MGGVVSNRMVRRMRGAMAILKACEKWQRQGIAMAESRSEGRPDRPTHS